MSDYKGPFLEEIYREWEPLAFPPDGTPISDVVDAAQRLFDKWYRDGKWLVGAEDAHLISSLRWSKLAVDNRFGEAEAAFAPWFEHPDRFQIDALYHTGDLSYLVGIKLQLGKDEEALEVFNEGRQLTEPSMFPVEMRNTLVAAAFTLPPDDAISPAWRQMMAWVADNIGESLVPDNPSSFRTYADFIAAWNTFAGA